MVKTFKRLAKEQPEWRSCLSASAMWVRPELGCLLDLQREFHLARS
jgi:hypothetical protein